MEVLIQRARRRRWSGILSCVAWTSCMGRGGRPGGGGGGGRKFDDGAARWRSPPRSWIYQASFYCGISGTCNRRETVSIYETSLVLKVTCGVTLAVVAPCSVVVTVTVVALCVVVVAAITPRVVLRSRLSHRVVLQL